MASQTAAEHDLRPSLESTRDGLRALLGSLERSHLPQAVEPYREMQRVLVLQREWYRQSHSSQFDPLWEEIATIARDIRALLLDFSRSLEQVARLDDQPLRAPTTLPSGRAVLTSMLAACSTTEPKLALALDVSPDELGAVVDGLVADGLIERQGWGRGASLRLGEAFRDQAGTLADNPR